MIVSLLLVVIITLHSMNILISVDRLTGLLGILIAGLYLFAGGAIEKKTKNSMYLFIIAGIIGLFNGIMSTQIAMYFWSGIAFIFAGLTYYQIILDHR